MIFNFFEFLLFCRSCKKSEKWMNWWRNREIASRAEIEIRPNPQLMLHGQAQNEEKKEKENPKSHPRLMWPAYFPLLAFVSHLTCWSLSLYPLVAFYDPQCTRAASRSTIASHPIIIIDQHHQKRLPHHLPCNHDARSSPLHQCCHPYHPWQLSPNSHEEEEEATSSCYNAQQ